MSTDLGTLIATAYKKPQTPVAVWPPVLCFLQLKIMFYLFATLVLYFKLTPEPHTIRTSNTSVALWQNAAACNELRSHVNAEVCLSSESDN